MTVPLVRVRGDAFSCGRQHGAARAAELHAFLNDGLARLNRIMPRPMPLDALRPALDAYADEITRSTPLLAEEVHGLAAGAGIDIELAWLLQVRREVMGYQRIPAMGDCTTYARAGNGHPVLAQTIDLNGDLDDQIYVLEVARVGSPRQVLVVSFGGLLGYLGVNSDGLAIGLNLVLGGDWRPGLPPYLAIRHLLDNATTVEEAVEILRGLRIASSRSLMFCDSSRAAYVEILGDEMRMTEAAELVHANHFLDSSFARHDQLNVFARNFSVQRMQTCGDRLAGLAADADVEEHFAVLSTAPIRVEGSGDIRRERTVGAVVMLPGLPALYVRPGDPAVSHTSSFALDQEKQQHVSV